MAQRKLQQEIDKEFKRVAEGVQAFDGIYDKLSQSTNASQKDKLEDALKKEIKKLQRSRDKIKGWASQNDIKDKKPLLEQRKLIESRMEMFKAVEKEMKTKAYSKEGLSAAAKLDPKEREKMEVCQFLSDMVDELSRQIESHEAEAESLQAGLKKGKKDAVRADRTSELERLVERHKWHSGKLEILLRSLENGSVETDQVKEIEEGIKYYVEQNQEIDFVEDEGLYDELNLEEEEDLYGMNNDNDKVSSQDTQSIQDEPPDHDAGRAPPISGLKHKQSTLSEASAPGRRSSIQLKSPLPTLSPLQSSLPSTAVGKGAESMRPAPLPSIPTGQTLKYASAAAAATASDKNGVGIAPLPPPPPATTSVPLTATVTTTTSPPPVRTNEFAASAENSTTSSNHLDATGKQVNAKKDESPKPHESIDVHSQSSRSNSVRPSPQILSRQPIIQAELSAKTTVPISPDSATAGVAVAQTEMVVEEEEEEQESIYHLPSSLTDLLDSFEMTKQRARSDQPFDLDMLKTSRMTYPDPSDAEKPKYYRPMNPYAYTPSHYPQEPLGIFDDSRLYSRIDTDTLFYAFYYQQGTYQQYLAARALKSQSWRFHKQYQTWFQRHEEPKSITEEFEQGTYRFFDYESTWMNRRKADFKFAYKFLEDDL